MKRVEQPDSAGVQFVLGLLHLYAMGLAGVAMAVHGLAVAHHWQRAGLLQQPRPTSEIHDLTYREALQKAQGGA